MAVCAISLFVGSACFAADDVPGAPHAVSGVQADQEIEALLLKTEQQISAGRTMSPPGDNALATWQRVTRKASPSSPGIVRALTDFRAHLQNRAAEEKKSRLVSVDFTVFADMANELLAHAGDAAAPSSANPPAAPSEPAPVGNSSATPTPPGPSKAGIAAAPAPAPLDAPAVAGASPVAGTAGPDAASGTTALAVAVPRALPTTRPPTAQEQSMAASYARQGDEMLAIKDISAARKFYEYAANAGSARAATALARTHDPEFLAQLGAVGVRPDPALAATWYRKAAALGDPDAKARMSALTTEAPRP